MAIEKKKVNLCEIFKLRLLQNIEKINKSKSAIFRFVSLLIYLFYDATMQFLGMTRYIWNRDECIIKLITQCYRAKDEGIKDGDIGRMMKNFQVKMK